MPTVGITSFDCVAHPDPIQILVPATSTQSVDPYEVRELDLVTGEYMLLYQLDQIPVRCIDFLRHHCVGFGVRLRLRKEQ